MREREQADPRVRGSEETQRIATLGAWDRRVALVRCIPRDRARDVPDRRVALHTPGQGMQTCRTMLLFLVMKHGGPPSPPLRPDLGRAAVDPRPPSAVALCPPRSFTMRKFKSVLCACHT